MNQIKTATGVFFTRIPCVKSVGIRRFAGPYSVRIREKTDQKFSEYGLFSRSAKVCLRLLRSEMYSEPSKISRAQDKA